MKPGNRIEVAVESLNAKGDGVARVGELERRHLQHARRQPPGTGAGWRGRQPPAPGATGPLASVPLKSPQPGGISQPHNVLYDAYEV